MYSARSYHRPYSHHHQPSVAPTYCGVGNTPPNPSTAPERVRPSGRPREEIEDPPDLRRQATRRVVRVGSGGPRCDFPAERTAPDRVSGDATRQGSLGPPGARREGIHIGLQVRLRPRTRGAGSETRGRRDRGGDVLQTPQGTRGPLQPSPVIGVPSASPG